jgi:GAF domain-containing protein/HAMP domain-containing protein
MNWIFDQFLRRVSVRIRIISSFMLIMLFAGSIAPIILTGLGSLVARMEQTTNVDSKVERLLLLALRRVAISQLSLSQYIQGHATLFEVLDDANNAIQVLREAQEIANTTEQINSIEQTIRSLEIYRQQVIDLQKARVARNEKEVSRLEVELQNRGDKISDQLELIVNDNAKKVAAANEEVLNDTRQSINFGYSLIIIGFILALIVSILISISVTRPLDELREGAELFQQTSTELSINTAGSDEFSTLAQVFNNLTKQIGDLISSLETRVSQRTVELNKALKYIERRAKQFETIAKVSQSISGSSGLQELLPYIVNVISDQFSFYHVGIFLNDTSSQYAILAAANSSGGKRMLERGHQLRIGAQGIVGYVTSTGKARIALDVGQDVVYFNNPDLPETHSEMALPLRIAGKVAGALDIQSTESKAFSDEDVEVLSALADQVGLAIQNARLFDQTQKTLAEAEVIQRQYLRDTWSRLPKEENFAGFRYTALGATLIKEEDESPKIQTAGKHSAEIHAPIVLRGETIGTLSVMVPHQKHATPDQMDLVKAVAERVALSAENARLFDETTRRAERERIVSDISSKIGSSFRTENILETAAHEISNLLEEAEIIIKLEPPKK